MKVVLRIAVVLMILLGIAYLAAGYTVYDKLSKVTIGSSETLTNTPAHFITEYQDLANFDTTPYFIPRYEEVSFASRQPGITLSGWYAEASPSAPAVILTHGIGTGKIAINVLVPAGMLYKNGFNVLLFDLRNHGQSSVDNGRTSIGNKEYLDVLGAWDYLVKERGYDPGRVGLFGVSLGAGSTLNAFAAEPAIAAALVDSPFADLQQIISEELARTGYPTFLAPAGIIAARLFNGVDLLAHTPKDAIRKDNGRPIFIIHGLNDERINVRHTRQLVELAQQTGANVNVWYVDGAGHVKSMFVQPKEYEQKIALFYKGALGAAD